MVNYFDILGFGNIGERAQQAATNTQNLFAGQQNMDIQKQNQARQVKADEQAMLKFQNDQQKLRAAQGAGALYNALISNNDAAATAIVQEYAQDINTLGDPSFTVDSVAQLMQTPEGKEQLKQMSLGMIQMAGGPEQMARFTAAQAKPESQADATAQIKNTAEYRRYTQAIRDAVASGDTQAAKDLIAERDFFVNQVDSESRARAAGLGAGQAKLTTEQWLTPELVERTREQEAAKLGEQQAIKRQEATQKNNTAFDSYNQAVSSVRGLSDKAGSGVFGLAPAVFADDRLFEGAIAILRPAIKDVVRGAGEGTFTDADQRVMDQMLPSRFDSPEVRMAKLGMLDNYIRAKLGQPPVSLEAPQQAPQSAPEPISETNDGEFTIIRVKK